MAEGSDESAHEKRTTSPMQDFTRCEACIGGAVFAIGLYMSLILPIVLRFGGPFVEELRLFFTTVVLGIVPTILGGIFLNRYTGVPNRVLLENIEKIDKRLSSDFDERLPSNISTSVRSIVITGVALTRGLFMIFIVFFTLVISLLLIWAVGRIVLDSVDFVIQFITFLINVGGSVIVGTIAITVIILVLFTIWIGYQYISSNTIANQDEGEQEEAHTKDVVDRQSSDSETNDDDELGSNANPLETDFEEARLSGRDLEGVVFSGLDLTEADFKDANLSDADLSSANLSDADLSSANLSDADLSSSDLRGVNLSDADIKDANLSDANLRGANLFDANLKGTNLSDANLRESNLDDISVNGATTCQGLYRRHDDDDLSGFTADFWDATALVYHNFKTAFNDHGLIDRAHDMHVQERRIRSFEARAEGRYLKYMRLISSRFLTGHGVRVRYLGGWMTMLFLFSTATYVYVGVENTLLENIYYSVLTFTAVPPRVPTGVPLSIHLMTIIETLFGTLSIVLLGFMLGNYERF